MLRSLRSLLIATAFSLVVFSAVSAVAAPAALERIDVTLHAEQGGNVMLVAGTLPEKTPLPAVAELSAAAGSELQWIGEILGGPPGEDPELKYEKKSAKGVDLYRFTMNKSRTAQAEFPTKAGPLFDGTAYTSAIVWAASQDVPSVRLSIRVPSGAKLTTPAADASMQPSDDGYSVYTKVVKGVKAGDELDFKLVYTLPAAGAAPVAGSTTETGASNTSSAALAVFIVIIAFALGAVVLTRRNKRASVEAHEPSPASAEEADEDVEAGPTRGRAPAQEPAQELEPAPGLSGPAKRKLVTAIIIGVLVVVTAVVGVQTSKPKVSGDSITEAFNAEAPCANATIPLVVPDGADPAATAKTVFDVLRPIANTATFNAKTSSVEVGFCESKSSEAAIRSALTPTGLVGQGAPAQ